MRISELKLPELPKKLDSTSLTVSEEETLKYIKKFAPIAFKKAMTGDVIYRGMYGKSMSNFLYFDSSKYTRRSRNTDNYYTLLIDLLPSWRNMPKRSKSSICTTSDDCASDYGNLWVVLPFNDAKIGVCSNDDFWFSFRNVKNLFGASDLDNFCITFRRLLKKYQLKNVTTIEEMKNALNELNKRSIEITPKIKVPKGKFISHINDAFHPGANDITSITISEYEATDDRELFIEGKVFFLSIELFKKLKMNYKRV